MPQPNQLSGTDDARWIMRYYTVRAIVSAIWVALAFSVGRLSPLWGLVLVAAYPAWDCLANYYDARYHGGMRSNPTQAVNTFVSAAVTIAVVVAATHDFHAVVSVIGFWAIFAGLLQLTTAIRRWRGYGAQWPMILSGAQSALAGTFFIKQASDLAIPLDITSIAPYAALGATYFAISALILTIAAIRHAGKEKVVSS